MNARKKTEEAFSLGWSAKVRMPAKQDIHAEIRERIFYAQGRASAQTIGMTWLAHGGTAKGQDAWCVLNKEETTKRSDGGGRQGDRAIVPRAREKEKSYLRLYGKCKKYWEMYMLDVRWEDGLRKMGQKAGRERTMWVFPHLHCPLSLWNTETFHFKV